jgi:hypothetical protein
MRSLSSIIIVAVWLTFASATAAEAVGAFAAIGALIKGSVFLQAVLKLTVSVALSRLSAALAPKQKTPGIKTEGTSSGSQNPASFIMGLYATNGVAVCPPMSHSGVGSVELTGVPNGYLVYVIELADKAGHALAGYIINGERVTIGGTAHADYGFPIVGGKYDGRAYIKFYDGTQTTVDAMLLAKYGSYPERPWTSAMVGRGIPYAICTFLYDRSVFSGFPTVRFELLGIPLYDPRKDTTVGGSGAHRWANPATWERTNNPIIMVYNIHRGITLPGGHIWGGNMPAEDLPLASVFAAANACDGAVDNGASGIEARFRAGYEVFVTDEPAEVCEELLKACLGEAADVGGRWRFQAGDPELPVFLITDSDIVTSIGRERQPFPSIEGANNGITASYPDPAVQWEPNEAPPVYNATWETEDGGRRRVVNVDFNAVPYAAQVQRNMLAMIADDRRFLTHAIPLPPEATVLEPLDTLEWTSAAYGYTTKLFEVISTQEDLNTGIVQITLRERDPEDTETPPGYFVPVNTPSTIGVQPAILSVPSFVVTATAITGSAGEDRRPDITIAWNPENFDVRGVEYEIRRNGTTTVITKGNIAEVSAGQVRVSEGILPSTAYQVRAIPVSDQQTSWTAWTLVTTLDVQITRPDIEDGAVSDQFQSVQLGTFTKLAAPSGTVHLSMDMGAIGNGQIWRRGVQFQAKNQAGVGVSYQIALQRRRAINGEAISAWASTVTWTVSATDITWDQYTDAGGLTGAYDDFEYRLVTDTLPAGMADAHEYIRDMYLTLARVTK